jgi:hypothetical protein
MSRYSSWWSMLRMLALVSDSERDNITELALTALDSYSLHRPVLRSPSG